MIDAIVVEDLTKYYGDLLAVDHVSFNVHRGEVFGFLGPNGAGKTTTIRMLVGLTIPSNGTAHVGGYDIGKDMIRVKRIVGVAPETSNLYNELTLWENLLFVSRLYHVPKRDRAEHIKYLLERFNLKEKRDVKFGGLSKGLKRRAVIAAAMVHQPEIVFLDEPTAGLDVMSAISLREFIKDLRIKETTVFLTTHYIEEADQLCDRIAILVKGRVVTVDTPEIIKSSVEALPVIKARFSRKLDTPLLDELKNLRIVESNGREIVIEVKNVDEALKSLVKLSLEHGIFIEEVNTVKPSLEDAFVRLTGLSLETMKFEKERGGS